MVILVDNFGRDALIELMVVFMPAHHVLPVLLDPGRTRQLRLDIFDALKEE